MACAAREWVLGSWGVVVLHMHMCVHKLGRAHTCVCVTPSSTGHVHM